jgi:hypothetical protein
MPSRFDPVYSTDDRERSGFVMDFRPTTLLEQSQMGVDRVNKPVGDATGPRPEIQTTGGRGTTDTESALRLGAQGRK